jgi:extracellular factor (EF) 3-hydroxypalmitic acid methyl ester biosynthesis protein
MGIIKMKQSEIKIQAKILDGDDYIPIEAQYLSKYSVYIRFLNGKSFPNGFVFKKFIFNVNGSKIKLGPCKLLKDQKKETKQGKLVFLKDIYDLNNLFYNNTIVKLQSSFINLPLILGHKDNIKAEFKEYTANLSYDLNVYKNLFDQIDDQIKDEKVDVQKLIRKSIRESDGRKFMAFLDEKLIEMEGLVSGYSIDEHERHGFYFRKQLWNMILCSPIMTRTNLKPRGYAGDFEMMKMIYDNNYEGNSIFGMVMHKHPMEHPAAQAVRTRRKLIANSFQEIESSGKWGKNRDLSILSVACGPAYELQDIITNSASHAKYHFTLLDQDKSALDAAKLLVSNLETKLSSKLKVSYLNESVRTMLTTQQISEKWGKFHFIYSMGLFDYLTPPAARVVIQKLFQLLVPGGEMIIGNFHASNPSKYYMEYWLDWVLYYRTEDEFLALLGSETSAYCSVFFENTGSQMFLHVKKES